MSTDKRQNPLKIKDFSVCPYYIVLADPARKGVGNRSPVQFGQDAKGDFGGQILGVVGVAALSQAEIEDFVEIFGGKLLGQPLGFAHGRLLSSVLPL